MKFLFRIIPTILVLLFVVALGHGRPSPPISNATLKPEIAALRQELNRVSTRLGQLEASMEETPRPVIRP